MYDTGVEPDERERMVTLITCNSRLDKEIRMAVHGICHECYGIEKLSRSDVEINRILVTFVKDELLLFIHHYPSRCFGKTNENLSIFCIIYA